MYGLQVIAGQGQGSQGEERQTDRQTQKERERRGVCIIVCVCTVVFPLSLSAFKLLFSHFQHCVLSVVFDQSDGDHSLWLFLPTSQSL